MLSALSTVAQEPARQTLSATGETCRCERSTAATGEDHHRLERGDHHLALTTTRVRSSLARIVDTHSLIVV